MIKNILVLEAHYDDAIFGCFGSLLKLKEQEENSNIFIYTICRGRKDDTTDNRKTITQSIYQENDFKFNDNPCFYDTDLNLNDIALISSKLNKIIEEIRPDTILFPKKDLHPDHELCNRIGKIISRPTPINTYLKNVMEYSILSSDTWNFDIQDTSGYYVNALSNTIFTKRNNFILKFTTELKSFPDLRSTKAIHNHLLQNGYKYGFDTPTELLKIIYQRRE